MNAGTLQLQSRGYYLAGVAGQFQADSSVYRGLQLFLEAPKVLRMVVRAASGEALSTLSPDEARALQEGLAPAYMRLKQSVATARGRWGAFGGLLLRGWFKKMDQGLEAMEDILETLAWGSDPDLRGRIDSAVRTIQENAIQLG